MDTNGDGIGDLKGIVQKIPYIADLGADTIWISPFFTSPMRDFGYDISDYRGVDPIFGTLDDFDDVVKSAHAHGLKVMIDQVWGHTSDLHPWFKESRKTKDNPKRDWYIWSNPKEDGFYPNNWISIFGGPAWTWDVARQQYYLHHFLASQPALNLRHPEVFDAVMHDALFWVERGVDGFRIDAVPHFLADPQLRDNPPAKRETDETFFQAETPRKMQENIYTQSHPDLFPWIEQSRAFFRSRGKNVIMLGEIMTAGLDLPSETVKGDNRMDTAYTSGLIGTGWTAAEIRNEMHNVQKAFDNPGKMCWAMGNHDVVRFWSRIKHQENAEELWRLIVAWYFCVEGYLCWYQGDELQLTETELELEQIQDPFGKTFWPDFKGRDGCRTPMPWEWNKPHGNFTTAKPWLPVPPEHLLHAADVQETQENSALNHTKLWMHLRKRNPALSNGKTVFHDEFHPSLIVFERQHDNQTVLCVFNFDHTESFALPKTGQSVLAQVHVEANQISPYGYYIAVL